MPYLAMIMKTKQKIRAVSPAAPRNPFRESFLPTKQIESPPIIRRVSIRYQYCYFLNDYGMDDLFWEG
jgi:hypothetical protein